MKDDLVRLLQQLGDAEIDDLSVAHDALEEIVALRVKTQDLFDDKERWFRMCEIHTERLQNLQAKLDALMKALDDLIYQVDRPNKPEWLSLREAYAALAAAKERS